MTSPSEIYRIWDSLPLLPCKHCKGKGKDPRKRTRPCPQCGTSGRSRTCSQCQREVLSIWKPNIWDNPDRSRCTCYEADRPFGDY